MSQEKIERWNEVDGNLDNGEKLQAFLDSTTDAYAILQLRRTDETVYERFESYEALKRQCGFYRLSGASGLYEAGELPEKCRDGDGGRLWDAGWRYQ